MTVRISAVVGLVLASLAAPTAIAHHAFSAEFDANLPIRVQGKIVQVDWINPHAWVHVEDVKEDGTKQVWQLEAGTPNTLLRRGLTKRLLQPGTEVVVRGYQSKDKVCVPICSGSGRDITFPDGTKLFMGSSGTGAPRGRGPIRPSPRRTKSRSRKRTNRATIGRRGRPKAASNRVLHGRSQRTHMRGRPRGDQMKTIARAAAFVVAAWGLLGGHAIAQDASDGTVTTDTHRFQMLADGVYLAMYTVPMFNSNSLVVINHDDVLVVDSHITPNAAKQLLAGIARLTDKPITTLVYTHFHYDHAHGTQAFGELQIIGHEFTRETMAGDPHNEPTFLREKSGHPRTIAWLESQLEAAGDEQREQLEYRLGLARARAESTKTIEPVPPDTTLHDRLTLFRGDREIQIIILRPRPHRWRRRGLPAGGQARLHRRHGVQRPVLPPATATSTNGPTRS